MTSQELCCRGFCHICKTSVEKEYQHYLKEHPKQRRYKIYSPLYDYLCKYKNCWGLGECEGFCKKHLKVVII